MIFFFAVKTPVKSSVSEFIYKKVKKNFATSKLLLYFVS